MRARVFQGSQQETCRHGWVRSRVGLLAALSIVVAAAAWADEPRAPELPHAEQAPVLIAPTAVGDIEYRAGRGLRIGDTGLTVGGFSTVAMSRFEGDRARFRFDDLDLFLFFDPTPYMHVFADLAFDQLLELDDGGHENSTNAEASVERLYGDLSVSDPLNVRFGKFLTPVGRWNQVPAEPLVWTTSRPLVTGRPFDEHVSGAALWGRTFPPGGSLTYTLYGQFLDAFASSSRGSSDAFDPTEKRSPADNSAGARLDYSALKGWAIGASYFTFSRHGEWNHLGGFDGLWQGERWEVSGEFLAGRGDPDGHRIVGLYVQPVVQLANGVHAVGRYEYYDPGAHDPPLHLFDLGVAWRPISFLILKADYLFANRSSDFDPPGIHASVSLLF
jgi:hypothetical protein